MSEDGSLKSWINNYNCETLMGNIGFTNDRELTLRIYKSNYNQAPLCTWAHL